MSISSIKAEQREKDCGCHAHECVETNYPTQKAINTERQAYCNAVYVASGEVGKAEQAYNGENILYKRKKCMFVWTEGNYQRYRNTEIILGTELMQTTESIKTNVGEYIKWGTDLSTKLKDVFKAVKAAKGKLNDLRNAACALDGSKTDSCYQSEWTILTGKPPAKCGDEGPGEPPKDYPDKCKDIDKTICELICMPKKGLDVDINSIFRSSSEIIGIQVFSNIGTLDQLQKNFGEKSKAFDTHLQDVMKTRESDLKKLQESLVKSVQDKAKAVATLYTSRSNFEALYDTTRYLCCPKCGCVSNEEDNCKPRLHDCECKICEICGDVKQTFCGGDDCGCNDNPSQAD